MSAHTQRALEQLKERILSLGGLVEESLREAVYSLQQRDEILAAKVISDDTEIDDLEVDIEEECLKFLALYQPVAADLRFIVATLKINNDLERIGDLAVNIAERAAFLANHRQPKAVFDFQSMASKSQRMLQLSLDALVKGDVAQAFNVCVADEEVDEMNREMYIQVQNAILKYPEDLECLIHLLSISRHLERAADLAEEVIYMVEGKIIRHKSEEYVSSRLHDFGGSTN
jgi:phosphate transport system protein